MSEDTPDYVSGEISEKISAIVSGEDYIKFTVLRERIVFDKKMTNKEKTSEIIKIALCLLEKKVDEFVKNGVSFVYEKKLTFSPPQTK